MNIWVGDMFSFSPHSIKYGAAVNDASRFESSF